MTNPLEHVVAFFPTGTAEGDADILDRVFIYAHEFGQVISPPARSPHLLVGSKGSGKTAVLNFSQRLLDDRGVPNIMLTPLDINSSEMAREHSTGDLARSFYETITDSIVTHLSSTNAGWFSGDYTKLYDYAVARGLRPPDYFSKVGAFFSDIAKPILLTDLNTAFPHLASTTRTEVEVAITKIVGRKGFYVFIDDTDQVALPGVDGHLNRVWALLLAVRRLTYDIRSLRAVVSLRTEVWQRMKQDDFGQRDQTDHFERLIVKMHTHQEHVGRIVDRRLSLAAAAANAPVEGYQHFFDGAGARAPTSGETRLWRDLILVRTRARPRDAIQLTNELARSSIQAGKARIDESVFQKIMPDFSRAIASQFADEARPEFPGVMEYLSSLADVEYDEGGFTMTAEGALKHFSRMLSRHPGTLYGRTLSQNDKESAFAVWSFFYQAGVLNARVSDTSRREGYKHLDPSQDPTLVIPSRWNEIQSMLWEVNTVYRDFLINLQKERALRSGLPRKPPRRR